MYPSQAFCDDTAMFSEGDTLSLADGFTAMVFNTIKFE